MEADCKLISNFYITVALGFMQRNVQLAYHSNLELAFYKGNFIMKIQKFHHKGLVEGQVCLFNCCELKILAFLIPIFGTYFGTVLKLIWLL